MTYLDFSSDGSFVKDLSAIYLLVTALSGFIVVLVWRRIANPTIPIVNSYSGDINSKKAQSIFMSDARGLIKAGIQKVSWLASYTNTAANVYAV
jgi:ABC-type sugar transport system permease subunit